MDKKLSKIFNDNVTLGEILKAAREITKKEKPSLSEKGKLEQLKMLFTKYTQYQPQKSDPGKNGNLDDFIVVYDVAGMLSKGGPEIVQKIAREIAVGRYNEGLRYLELRTSFPSGEDETEIFKNTLEKLKATIAGLKEAESSVNSGLCKDEIGLETRVVNDDRAQKRHENYKSSD